MFIKKTNDGSLERLNRTPISVDYTKKYNKIWLSKLVLLTPENITSYEK